MQKTNFTIPGFILILLALIACNNTQTSHQPLKAPLTANNFDTLTSYSQMLTFLEKADSVSEKIHLSFIGESVNKRDIPLVQIYQPGTDTSQVLDMLILAQQHGDEPSGKEGALLLVESVLNGQFEVPSEVRLLLVPMANPDGAENDQRRNAANMDLNRDHLLQLTPEVQAIHRLFHRYQPEVTVDIHEYDPYSEAWKTFGFYKNFDIQLGGLTNPNINDSLSQLFYAQMLPAAEEAVTSAGYTFLEYTLGDLFDANRLRHSTVHIDDGRQSFGIQGTFSMIIEGKYGHNSNDNLQRRAQSQFIIIRQLIETVASEQANIRTLVATARNQLANQAAGDSLGIRFTRLQSSEPYHYPLLHIESGTDSVFLVSEYYPTVIATLSVEKPQAYLVAATDTAVTNWLKRMNIHTRPFEWPENSTITQYKITQTAEKECDEGWNFLNVVAEKETVAQTGEQGDFLLIPLNQRQSAQIVLALEPASQLALHNEVPFQYLAKGSVYPILRVEW